MSAQRGRKKGSGKTRIGIDRLMISSKDPEQVLFKLNELLYDPLSSPTRKNPRVAVSLPVTWRSGKKQASDNTYTLSREGMYIKTISPLPVNAALEVSFLLPGDEEEIRAQARVIRSVDPEEAKSQGLVSGMAIVFHELQPGFKRRLDHFIERLMKKRPAPIWI